ncbi:MAG TPA: alanine racemase [Planctomycetota bacterium]
MPPAPADPAWLAAVDELGCGSSDDLAIGGVAATELAKRFGTPLYVFDAGVLRRRLARVQQALGPEVRVLWSVKANPSLAVTRTLREAGAGAEIASLGELHLARAAGHPVSELRFAGPGKTDAEIEAAVEAGLGCFHVEAEGEVASIAAAARRRGKQARVAVRVNLPQELSGSRMRMGGRSSRFGIDEDQVPALLTAIRGEPALLLAGLHVYGGTQSFDANAFVHHATLLTAHATRWERECRVKLPELDLGGGFGTAAFAGDPSFDLAAAGRGIQELVRTHPGRRWFVELGRYLCAPAGVYLARVVRCKKSGGVQQVILDGGMHHHAAATGAGSVLRRAPLLAHATGLRAPADTAATLGGPLCTPADQFAEQAMLPALEPGDLVAVLHAGAYGLSFSPVMFLSHPTPAEVIVDGGVARIARHRGQETDVLRGQEP